MRASPPLCAMPFKPGSDRSRRRVRQSGTTFATPLMPPPSASKWHGRNLPPNRNLSLSLTRRSHSQSVMISRGASLGKSWAFSSSSAPGWRTVPPRPRADFTVTALESRDGLDILTGGAREVIYYDQTSERWAGEPYGSDHIGGYGCGPTAMSIVVSSLTGQVADPAQMAQLCVKNGYWAKSHGSYLSMVQGIAELYGLNCASLPPEEADTDTITQHLATGNLIVTLMGPGHFTSGGHFIVLRGITLEGSILVADPASQERSLTTWDLDLILEELSAKRYNGSPLWVISPIFS